MKKNLSLLLLCVLAALVTHIRAEIKVINTQLTLEDALKTPYTITKLTSTNINTLEIEFELNALEIKDSPTTPNSKICEIPGVISVTDTLLPALPIVVERYNIPTTEECQITISNAVYTDTTVVIGCGNNPYIADTSLAIEDKFNIQPYDGFYPTTAASTTTIQNYKGIPIHHICFAPVMYDYNNHTLRIYKSFKATLQFSDITEDTESDRSPIFKANRTRGLTELVDYTFPLNDYNYYEYPKERTQDYIIIANQYTYGLEKFVEWKKTLGYRVHVIKDIPGRPDDYIWTWEELSDIINAKYNELDNLAYVLFWGHPTSIPGIPIINYNELPLYMHFEQSTSYSAYSLLDGLYDITPKFNVGRICALNQDQNEEAIDKIINYERNPVTDPLFYSSAFIVGQFEPKGADSASSPDGIRHWTAEDYGFIYCLEKTRRILIDNGFNVKRIYRRHPWMVERNYYPEYWSSLSSLNLTLEGETSTSGFPPIPDYLHHPTFCWNGTKADIQNSLNQGSLLGIYYSHGNDSGWYAFDQFTTEDFLSGECGRKNPLIFSITCTAGKAQWHGSFANRLSWAEHGPIGHFASSDVTHLDQAKYLLYGLTNALFPNYSHNDQPSFFSKFTPSFRLGDILNRGMQYVSYRENFSNIGLMKHILLSYTCFGDPSIDFNTEVPTSFTEPLIEPFGNLVKVKLRDNTPYPVYLNFYETETDRVESYEYNGEDYYFEASPEASEVKLSITSHNKIPYITNIAVNDGESYNPRVYGRISSTSFDSANGEVYVEVERDHSRNFALKYIVFDSEGVENDVTVDLGSEQDGVAIAVQVGFKGYIQLYLLYPEQNVLLDSRRIQINFR